MVGAMAVAWKLKVYPKFNRKACRQLLWILLIMLVSGFFINYGLDKWVPNGLGRWKFLILAWVYNLITVWISLKPIKAVAKGLTID